jgi:glycosyltransferase involved in cell wall biosynthesis
MFNYKPSYVWPNPAFPFRVYYESEELRIFIIENIQHNWEWLSVYNKKFRPNDYFFVYCGWYHSEFFAKEAEKIFDVLGLNRERFFFMFNDDEEKENFSTKGFCGEVINQNAWLDENLVMNVIPETQKIYDSIYVGRFSPFKRHELASTVNNLALVAGTNHSKQESNSIPNHVYLNEKPLSPDEVCLKINESSCGLILSAEEGACFASSEYLLCGIPVVSTVSKGGRSVWYNEYNSIICDDSPDAVSNAVEELVLLKRDPFKIRNAHISLSKYFRAKFVAVLANLFYKHGQYNVDAQSYFDENFIHKLRKSYKPNFEEIFK